MELILKRLHKTKISTIGDIRFNGRFLCYTIEDVEREVKIKGITAIPKGRYEIIITMSNRFKRLLPLLLNVPNYEGIRIHPGNTAEDTEGCILPGMTRGVDTVTASKKAFEILFILIKKTLDNNEKVYITIE